MSFRPILALALAAAALAAGCVSPVSVPDESIAAAGAPAEDAVLLHVDDEVRAADGYSRSERIEVPDGVSRLRVAVDYDLAPDTLFPEGVCVNVGGVTQEERAFHLVFAGEDGIGHEWRSGVSERGNSCQRKADQSEFIVRQNGGAIFVEAGFEGYDGRFAVRVTALGASG